MFGKIKQVTKQLLQEIIRSHPIFFVNILYCNIWNLRSICRSGKSSNFKLFLYRSYFEHYGAWIGLGAVFDGRKHSIPL